MVLPRSPPPPPQEPQGWWSTPFSPEACPGGVQGPTRHHPFPSSLSCAPPAGRAGARARPAGPAPPRRRSSAQTPPPSGAGETSRDRIPSPRPRRSVRPSEPCPASGRQGPAHRAGPAPFCRLAAPWESPGRSRFSSFPSVGERSRKGTDPGGVFRGCRWRPRV